jgi:hypothetical protein
MTPVVWFGLQLMRRAATSRGRVDGEGLDWLMDHQAEFKRLVMETRWARPPPTGR